jgi:hypothetical protein
VEKKQKRPKPLSLYPLKFDDAVTALLKTKPMPKTKKSAGGLKKSSK